MGEDDERVGALRGVPAEGVAEYTARWRLKAAMTAGMKRPLDT